MSLTVVDLDGAQSAALAELVAQFGFTVSDNMAADFQLIWQDHTLKLLETQVKNQGPIWVDFIGPAAEYRRKQSSVRNESIAKACGLKSGKRPSILDATAGLGRDGFVLAALGSDVNLVERNPAVAALLFDGLNRAKQDAELGQWIDQRLKLNHASSFDFLAQVADYPEPQKPDVVYLDPMFPHKKKSAAVKKEMKSFQGLVGADPDAEGLLALARNAATERVVVKRPSYAEPLAEVKASFAITSKKHRFDVYT